MKRYETYKNSGVEWIGEIPEGWEVSKLKYLLSGLQDGTHGTFQRVDYGYPLLSAKNIKESGIVIEEKESCISDTDYKSIIANGYPCKGDIALCCVGTIGRSCLYDYDYPMAFQRSVTFLRPNNRITRLFLLYCVKSANFQDQLSQKSKASAQSGVYLNDVANTSVLLPPLSEQQQISSYLDYKVGQIDSSLAKIVEQIEDLKSYRQSVISEAVTKGLNPNAKMKDSGVEWIGEIPEGWDTPKLKWMIDMRSGSSITSENILEEGEYVVYGGNGPRGYYNEYTNDGFHVLIGRQGALCGNINYAKGKFWATEHAVVCYPKEEMATVWLGEMLRAMNLNQYSMSAAQPGLSVERIGDLQFPLPPLSEQQQIASYLDSKTSKIDSSIEALELQKSQLEDYKRSVISEAVTGKVDLRGWKTNKC